MLAHDFALKFTILIVPPVLFATTEYVTSLATNFEVLLTVKYARLDLCAGNCVGEMKLKTADPVGTNLLAQFPFPLQLAKIVAIITIKNVSINFNFLILKKTQDMASYRCP
jgi:hypothetical protein